MSWATGQINKEKVEIQMFNLNPSLKSNKTVQKIIRDHGFEGLLIGKSYDLVEGEPYAYLFNYQQVRVSNTIMSRRYPRYEQEWVVLHECGHYDLQHSLDFLGKTTRENELQADLWACCKQNTHKYGVNALMRICNGDLNMKRFTVNEYLNHLRDKILHINRPISYGYFINEIRARSAK